MKTGQSAVIPCTVNSHCLNYNMEYKWFVFQENSHFEVNKDQSKYSLEGASLNIQSLNQTDSGIYHCAAVSSHEDPAKATQYIARGTTLVVKDTFKVMVRYILLLVSCILLAIYSVAIVALIILKKHGFNQVCRKKVSSEKKTSTKRVQFHDVLQELYNRKSLETNKQTARRKRSHVEAASAEITGSHDDIYQNV